MIEVRELTKRYGATPAVDRLTFSLPAGQVTGFLGPNGAGKSTTLRLILGLATPTSGTATIHGRPYRELAWPLREVGALVDAGDVHDGHTARRHLQILARSNRLPAARVDEVLEATGLTGVADRRVGGFSLGMRQRLGIAAALLGDPGVLVFDEPMNGLDTDGIRWIRGLLRRLADDGRTVLLSSHLMREMELVADHLVVIGQGRLVADTPMRRLIEDRARPEVLVRAAAADHARLAALVDRLDAAATPVDGDGWLLTGPAADPARLGRLALDHGIPLVELTPRYPSLEEVYTQMTHATVTHRAAP
ncbi:MAG TPA: ATP-binding cassette domain-containing protein [Acidimicrobiales bacterium]